MTTTTEEAPQPKKMSLAELRKYDGPLWVENLTGNYLSCNEKFGKDEIQFHLEPKGQSGSIDEMPKLVLSVAGFRKMIMRGDVRVSTDENMQERIELQIQEQIEQEKVRQANLLNSMEENGSSRDLVQKACLTCGSTIFQTVRDEKGGTPPLCPVHVDKAHLYPATLVADDQGNEVWKFSRPTMAS